MTRPSAVPAPVTAVLEASESWLPALMAKVEERLREASAGHGKLLAEDAGLTLEAGGKRLRPMLVLLCAGPEAGDAALRAAVAVELVHMATLVHDDVLDAAPLRRGHPTVVARSGRARALATGDLLFSRAFAELAVDGGQRLVGELSEASVALAQGELAQRQDAYDTSIETERYLERCRLKTARLFQAACVLGRLAAGGGAEDELARFGREVGLAFQLLDDVLDVGGPPERTGKARGTDLLDGTVTLPFILAAESDGSIAATDLRGLDPASAEVLCERIAATGALDRVRGLGLEMVERGKRALAGPGLDPEQRRLLGLVADGIVDRYS
jgi:geranylgeranyl pyrophosphate synthase